MAESNQHGTEAASTHLPQASSRGLSDWQSVPPLDILARSSATALTGLIRLAFARNKFAIHTDFCHQRTDGVWSYRAGLVQTEAAENGPCHIVSLTDNSTNVTGSPDMAQQRNPEAGLASPPTRETGVHSVSCDTEAASPQECQDAHEGSGARRMRKKRAKNTCVACRVKKVKCHREEGHVGRHTSCQRTVPVPISCSPVECWLKPQQVVQSIAYHVIMKSDVQPGVTTAHRADNPRC